MTDRRDEDMHAGPAHRLFLAYGDSTFAHEASAALTAALPRGWALSDEPDGATAIMSVDVPLDVDVVKRAGEDLRVIGTTAPLEDGVLSDAAAVRVVMLPTESSLSRPVVAEYSVMMMLALSRNLLAMARTTRPPWVSGRDTPILTDQATYVYNWTDLQGSGFLLGKTVGIIGVGTIGAAVARLLAPYQVRALYTQRHRLPAADEQQLGLEWREFDDLIRESDFVTLHHRLQEGPGGNEQQFGAREFAMMKPTAFIVNTARGRLIDEDALVEALRGGEIGGVALDVFRHEPLPPDHPLLSLAGDNVILTPHIAAGSEAEYWQHVLRPVLDAYEAALGEAAT